MENKIKHNKNWKFIICKNILNQYYIGLIVKHKFLWIFSYKTKHTVHEQNLDGSNKTIFFETKEQTKLFINNNWKKINNKGYYSKYLSN